MAANPDGTAPLTVAVAGLPVVEDCHGEQGVIAVAPLRLDLTGGFTDIPPFSSTVNSLHINAAFDLKVTVSCRMRRDRQVRVGFARDGIRAPGITDGRRRFMEAVRSGVAEFACEGGLDVLIRSEAPPGSGLGSSGSILVAAIKGCSTLMGVPLTPPAIARRAVRAAATAGIVGGQQDEFAAAHGSLCAYEFDSGGEARIRDFGSSEVCRRLEESLLVVQMAAGGRRTDVVADVVRAVRSGDRQTLGTLLHLQDLARELFDVMTLGRATDFPRYIGKIREAQCALHPRMCCPATAAMLEEARAELPELQYKILGGGGVGSCVLVHVPACDRMRAICVLKRRAKRVLRVSIRSQGASAEFTGTGATIARRIS